MNATLFYTTLSRALADPYETVYASEDLIAAQVRAVLAYSQYRPVLRRYGTGNLASDAPVGQILMVVGGTWSAGDALTVDAFGVAPETGVVQSVARIGSVPGAPIPFLQLTLQAPLASLHTQGALLVKTPLAGQSAAGLNVIAGQDTYPLPLDWIKVQQETFDLAVGAKANVRRGNGFYDAAYGTVNALSQQGMGGASNYAGGYGGSFGFTANGSVQMTSGQNCAGTVYRFLRNDPPLLTILPAPTNAQTLDFYYWGTHTMASVPDADMEPLLGYAAYAALSASAVTHAGQIDRSGGDVKEISSKAAMNLMTLANKHLARYEDLIVNIPYATSG